MNWAITILYLSGIFNFAFSQEVNIEPIREIKNLSTSKDKSKVGQSEELVKLTNSKVAMVNYELLKKDFPFLNSLTNSEIDEWLHDHVRYISKPQAMQNIVNSSISFEQTSQKAHRPWRYGRGLVFSAKDPNGNLVGLLDAKGAGGHRTLTRHIAKQNGIATLGECIREFLYERMISKVVDHSGVKLDVVGSYGVIYAGFDVIHKDGTSSPAGYYIRQAHARHYTDFSDVILTIDGKELFNSYGIYTNGNIQHTIKNEIYDFGHMTVMNHLDKMNIDENLRIPFSQWGFDDNFEYLKSLIYDTSKDGDSFPFSKVDRPWTWSHNAARDFVSGHATREDLVTHYKNMLTPVDEKLSSAAHPYDKVSKLRIGMSPRLCAKAYSKK